MNQTQLLARCRMSAFLEDTSVDFTDAWIIRELNDQLTQLYERAVVKARQGFWLKQLIQLITVGVDRYRMPDRAVSGGLHRVQIAYNSQQDWEDLPEVDEKQALAYELAVGQQDVVARFVMRSDQINLLPDPNAQNYALRIHYYVRPSRIVFAQFANAGVISSINTSTRTIGVTAVVSDVNENGVLTAQTTGNVLIDVVNPNGWHELQLVGEPATITASGFTFTCTGTGDMSTIKVGDVVRIADQTDWPCLPDDFHRTLADSTAIKILTMRRMDSSELQQQVAGDLSRFGDLLLPRVQTSAKAIVAPQMYRGQRRGWLVKYP